MLMIFSVDARHHGIGPVKYAWDPNGHYVASTGNSRVVHIFSRRGTLVDQIVPPSPSPCNLMEWNQNGELLAIVQANSNSLILWEPRVIKQHQLVDLPCKDISFLKWSKAPGSDLLAIGTNRGVVYIYDHLTGTKSQAANKHKRKITCGDWNLENKFAFGSEDRQITICLPDGRTIDQVKIKASPQSITFGGKTEDNDAILSVNMGRKTILLYDLNVRENALELAFQPRYGDIVSYRWFGNGYIIAGFSSGYVVIISTHLKEIGQEQYCAKFHENSLREIAYNEVNGTVATCGDNCIKVVRMSDWKEIAVEYLDAEASTTGSHSNSTATTALNGTFSGSSAGHNSGNNPNTLCFEDLKWTCDGKILSVSSHAGCLHNFVIMNTTMRTSLLDDDSVLYQLIKPIPAISMVLTVICVAFIAIFGMAVILDVSSMDLVRAVSGLAEVI